MGDARADSGPLAHRERHPTYMWQYTESHMSGPNDKFRLKFPPEKNMSYTHWLCGSEIYTDFWPKTRLCVNERLISDRHFSRDIFVKWLYWIGISTPVFFFVLPPWKFYPILGHICLPSLCSLCANGLHCLVSSFRQFTVWTDQIQMNSYLIKTKLILPFICSNTIFV